MCQMATLEEQSWHYFQLELMWILNAKKPELLEAHKNA